MGREVEDCVGDQQFMLCANLEQKENVAETVTHSVLCYFSTSTCIEITRNEDLFNIGTSAMTA